MYKVIKYFTDLQDSGYAYHEGDFFPREGFTVSQERINELSSIHNRRGIQLIEYTEPVDNFMNPPEAPQAESEDTVAESETEVVSEQAAEEVEKPKKKRGRPKNA